MNNSSTPPSPAGVIELRLRTTSQLFNSFDPSPFRERDLDVQAADYITAWAAEFGAGKAISLILHLPSAEKAMCADLPDAIRAYFTGEALSARRQIQRILRDGRDALVIGLLFLAMVLTVAEFIRGRYGGGFASGIVEGLTILGWVAMWRPAELLLYDWWPVLQRKRLLDRLSVMEVICRYDDGPAPVTG